MNIPFNFLLNKKSVKNFWKQQRVKLRFKNLLQYPFFLVFFFLFLSLPLVWGGFFFGGKFIKLKQDQSRLKMIEYRAKKYRKNLKNQTVFLNTYEKCDPNFLNHHLEGLHFLQKEMHLLKMIHDHPALHACPEIQKRFSYLTGEKNQLSFVEIKRQKSDVIEEIFYKQKNVIELKGEELQNLLSIVEGIPLDALQLSSLRPHLTIYRFDLKKKALLGRESYFLEMEFIKREPIKKGLSCL